MGLWQFQEGLFQKDKLYIEAYVRDNYTSDMMGMLGYNASKYMRIKEKGITSLLTNTYKDEDTNAGLDKVTREVGILWDIYYFILIFFFGLSMFLNVHSFLTFIFIALASYLLARELGMSPLFSILTGFFLTHIENFEFRMNNHGGLVSYHFPILLIWISLRLGKKPNLKNNLIYAFILFLNITNHGYYAYFGIFFSVPFVLGYWYILKSYKIYPLIQLIKNSFSGILFLFFLCLLQMPRAIWAMISPLLGFHNPNNDTYNLVKQVIRTYEDYNYWSLSNVFSIWQTGFSWLRKVFPFTHFNNENLFPTESFFRVGFLVVLFLFIIRYYLFNKIMKNKVKEITLLGKEIYIWILACFIMIAFSVNDSYYFSLVPFSYSLIQGFRVGIRALIYYEISVILLFLYSVYMLQTHWRIKNKNIYIFLILLIVYADVLHPGDTIWPKIYPAKKAPEKAAYLELKNKPHGLLLELPMSSERVYPNWENEYLYMSYCPWHRKTIINPFSGGLVGEVFREKMLNIWNNMTELDLENLRQAGVRYIAVHPQRMTEVGFNNQTANFSIFESTKLLKLVSSDSFSFIFEFIEPITTEINFLEKMKQSYP